MKNLPVLRLIAFDHCRALAPWCAVRRGSSAGLRVRRLAYEREESGWTPAAALEAGIAQVLYLATSLRQILLTWFPERRGVRAHYGIGSWQQLRDLVHLTWRGNLPPRVYYSHRLFRQSDRDVRLATIEHRELQTLHRLVRVAADTDVLDDKILFHSFCQKHGFPTPPILAAYANGAPLFPIAPVAQWQADLFCKPARSYASLGVSSWRYEPATDRYTDRHNTFDLPTLQSWLAQQSHDKAIIVQPRLANASDLHPITGDVLANCRIVTARRADGTIGLVLASLRIAWEGTIASDELLFCAGVDLATGVLHAAEAKQAALGSFPFHPQSGAPIAGRVLPRWPEMCALALRAHAELPEIVFVGWDLIDTDRGPMLLEGNFNWGGNVSQMAGNRPLGATEFSEIFLHHFDRRPRGATPC